MQNSVQCINKGMPGENITTISHTHTLSLLKKGQIWQPVTEINHKLINPNFRKTNNSVEICENKAAVSSSLLLCRIC